MTETARARPVMHNEGGVNSSSPSNGRDERRNSPLRLAAPAKASSTALVSRLIPQVPPPTPISPSSPSGSGVSGVSTAVAVEPLYRLPLAFYGGGSVNTAALLGPRVAQNVFSTFAPTAPSGGGGEVSQQLRGMACGTHLQASFNPNSSSSSSSSNAQDVIKTMCAAGPSAVEERVRRAAQTFESDIASPSPMGMVNAHAHAFDKATAVQVARGFRSPSTVEDGWGNEKTSGVVPLAIGVRRRRSGSLCTANSSSGSTRVFACAPATGWAGVAGASPSFSSLSSVQSPQSPAIRPPIMAPSTSMSMSALARSASNMSGIGATSTALTASAATAVAAASVRAPPSPFHSLLDSLSATPSTTATGDGALVQQEPHSFTAAVAARPWLQLWASHGLSRYLAAQLTRDAGVLQMRSALSDDARVKTSTASAAVTDGSVRAAAGFVRGSTSTTTISTRAVAAAAPLPPSALASGAVVPVSYFPLTLYEALLQLFSLLEQMEDQIVKLFTATTPTAAATEEERMARRAAATSRKSPATTFPASPAQSATDVFAAVVLLWCDVLLPRWPGELISLGCVEWWLRHPVWDSMMITQETTGTRQGNSVGLEVSPSAASASAKTCVMAQPSVSEDATNSRSTRQAREAEQRQQAHVHLAQEALVTSWCDGMRRLFDCVVDAFITAVHALLRCGSSSGGGHSGFDRARGAPCSGEMLSLGKDTYAGGVVVRPLQTSTRCRELLRLLTALYVDPPRALQQVFREVAPQTPSSMEKVKGEAGHSVAPSSPTASSKAGTIPGARQGASSLAASSTSSLHTNVPPQQQPQQQAEARSRARQLHYQLLYAVCRLCNELPLCWDGTTVATTPSITETGGPSVGQASAWRSKARTPFAPAACSTGEENIVLFAAAVHLAAAVAEPLRNVQLPMKGDLLSLTSRLAQQRMKLVQHSIMRERDYALCMERLCTLLTHAT